MFIKQYWGDIKMKIENSINYRVAEGITEENIKNLDVLIDIRERHKNCADTYQETIDRASKVLMSKGDASSLFGKFPIDQDCLIYDPYKGRLTTNSLEMDFKYYFDENDRIILTERYEDKELYDCIFYYYYEDHAEIVLYAVKREELNGAQRVEWKDSKLYRILDLSLCLPSSRVFGWSLSYEESIFSFKETELFITTNYCHAGERETTENFTREYIRPIKKKEDKTNTLPKKVPVFKLIKENMINILNKWKDIDLSVIWINCHSADLEMQYTTLKEDSEEKWNIAFYDGNEEKIINDENYVQVLEDLLCEKGCNNLEYLSDESDYFVNKMIKIIKELRDLGYINDGTAVILSSLEISENTFSIAKKINSKDTIKGFFEEFGW